jgi:hypothetical protein
MNMIRKPEYSNPVRCSIRLIPLVVCTALGMVGCAFPGSHSHNVTGNMAGHGSLRAGQTYRLTKDAMTDGVHLFGKDAKLVNGRPITAVGSTLNSREHRFSAPVPIQSGTRLRIRKMAWEGVVTISSVRIEFEVVDGRHAGRRLSVFNGPERFILGSYSEGTVGLNPAWFSLEN